MLTKKPLPDHPNLKRFARPKFLLTAKSRVGRRFQIQVVEGVLRISRSGFICATTELSRPVRRIYVLRETAMKLRKTDIAMVHAFFQ
jgi:hypothetical protein